MEIIPTNHLLVFVANCRHYGIGVPSGVEHILINLYGFGAISTAIAEHLIDGTFILPRGLLLLV